MEKVYKGGPLQNFAFCSVGLKFCKGPPLQIFSISYFFNLPLSCLIKGLKSQLALLQGEYQAGNTSANITNKIVNILDTLVGRHVISEPEYQEANNRIQNEARDTYDG